MAREWKDRSDAKWAHPELYEEGWYTLATMQNFVELAKNAPGVNEKDCEPLGQQMRQMAEASEVFAWKDYTTDHGCPEELDAPPVHIIVGTPKDMQPGERLPVVFSVAGGGLVNGGLAEMCAGLGPIYLCMSGVRHIEVCFTYRIAPTWQYPAAINDCHAAYQWMVEHAGELGIDTDKIVIWGTSTGGQLSLCTGFRIKRYGYCGAPMPRGIIIQVPVMDDTALTPSSTYVFNGGESGKLAWDSEQAYAGYKAYLGDRYADPTLPPEAVPNRATLDDVRGFPPVWVPADGEFEPGRDSLVKFAQLLWEADVFCDLHVWGGTNHQGFTAMTSDMAQRCNAIFAGAVRDAITYDFRRQWLSEER